MDLEEDHLLTLYFMGVGTIDGWLPTINKPMEKPGVHLEANLSDMQVSHSEMLLNYVKILHNYVTFFE